MVHPNARLAFDIVAQALSDRLRDRLDPRESGATELKNQLGQLCALLDAGDSPEARWQLTRLEGFITDWDVVAARMPEYADELRARFLSDEQRGGYAGTRSELALAAFLLGKGVSLTRGTPPAPDFAVSRSEGQVLLESTSAHLTTARQDNFKKIETAIRQKAKRSYCGPNALLHVDYTAILWRGGDALEPGFSDRARDAVMSTQWGVVLLSAFLVSSNANLYHRAVMRLDGPARTPALQSLLDEFLPLGQLYLGSVSIPPTS